MYILNPEVLSEDKIYYCNGLVSAWLIEQKRLPLFCKKGRMFGFARTELLKKAIKEIPFWLKLSKCL